MAQHQSKLKQFGYAITIEHITRFVLTTLSLIVSPVWQEGVAAVTVNAMQIKLL
jgi:hypothetical protein